MKKKAKLERDRIRGLSSQTRAHGEMAPSTRCRGAAAEPLLAVFEQGEGSTGPGRLDRRRRKRGAVGGGSGVATTCHGRGRGGRRGLPRVTHHPCTGRGHRQSSNSMARGGQSGRTGDLRCGRRPPLWAPVDPARPPPLSDSPAGDTDSRRMVEGVLAGGGIQSWWWYTVVGGRMGGAAKEKGSREEDGVGVLGRLDVGL